MPPSLLEALQAALGSAYAIERELGGRGMGRVFLAIETALSRRVVVKVLSPEVGAEVSADRFQREIQVAARLRIPRSGRTPRRPDWGSGRGDPCLPPVPRVRTDPEPRLRPQADSIRAEVAALLRESSDR